MKKIYIAVLIALFTTSIVFAAEYKRVVSLAPSVTESLFELGMENEVIGITIYCPKGNAKKEIIGTLIEPDIEKIAVLKPDLIIATKEGNNKGVVEKLARLGFEVYVMETASNFIEICSNFYALSKKVGKENIAAGIIDNAKDELNALREKTNALPKLKIFWEVGAKPLYTAGRQSFATDYNYYTGSANIYGDIDMRYFPVDAEDVILRNPDVIILVDMGDVSKEEIARWLRYKTLKAAKSEKVFMINVNDIFTPTPSTFSKGAYIVAKTLYPELFK